LQALYALCCWQDVIHLATVSTISTMPMRSWTLPELYDTKPRLQIGSVEGQYPSPVCKS
jgi:hypothetical protein